MSSDDGSPESKGGMLSSLRWVIGGKTHKASEPEGEGAPTELADVASVAEDNSGADDPGKMILGDALPEAPISGPVSGPVSGGADAAADDALVLGPSMQSPLQPGEADEESTGDVPAGDDPDETADETADDTGYNETGVTYGDGGEDHGAGETTAEEDTAYGAEEDGTEEGGVDEDGADEDGADEDGADEDGADDDGADEDGADEDGVDEGGVDEGGAAEAAEAEIPGADDIGDTGEDALEQVGEVFAFNEDEIEDDTGFEAENDTGADTGTDTEDDTGDMAAILGADEPDDGDQAGAGDIVDVVLEEDDDGLIRASSEALAGLSLATGGRGDMAADDAGQDDAGQDDAGDEPEFAHGADARELEETIRRVVREELAGEMGQRLTRNIQRMINEQIAEEMRRRG
jgi:hypothetical protein